MPIITITRGSLSATFKLSERLARELNCRTVTREEIIDHGRKYGIEEFLQAAKGIMESKPPHSWDPNTEQIQHYLAIYKAALMDFVVEGNVICHGLQTHYLLTDVPRVLRVKVVAPLEYRVRSIAEESEFSEAEARDYIQNVDSQRITWVKFLHGADFDDPTNYDLTLNMANLNLDAITVLIGLVVRRPEFRLDSSALKIIRDVHLKSVAAAYLIHSPQTRNMSFSIDCDSDNGHVKVTRIDPASDSDWQKTVKEVLSKVDLISTLKIARS